VAKRGKVALTVCSTAFQTLGRAQARALGNSMLPIAVIPHPFGGRSREDVRKLAEQCIDDIVKLLTREKT
jgi:predicted dienelactone hydrolase